MVKICDYIYPKSHEDEYKKYYENYSYDLHDFQKWSIEATVTGNHLLVCCPTGSGKTFSGEFAISYFHSKGKKVIYTSPIKALSNEKFHSFTQKYSDISFGLITGDIKTNPNADVLIMTTEILMNKLYQIHSNIKVPSSSISFDMDIENELGCVVFDEVHMIADENRGHVWEQSIMMLPRHIQMIGLSATLDNPESFAFWLENRGDINPTKQVFLTKKQKRAVPLIHYTFITSTTTVNKTIKDKSIQEEIKNSINKPFIIQDEKGEFNDIQYKKVQKILNLYEKNNIRVKRQHVLNKVTEYLVENEMLPALCYVFSRKQLEKCAEELSTTVLEFDSKVFYTADRECEQIIRKLPNYEEYLHLPEYINLVKMIRRGVGIHHAGLMPILREMVELLFARGFIKILFCTETMSVGINLPVKTTIFTDINKYNGEIVRNLYSHEYTQAAGRAGRLGLDTKGHVIHLNNLFRNVDHAGYKLMMNGKPQILTSKFKISFNLLLNLLSIGDKEIVKFAEKSMVTNVIDSQTKEIYNKIQKLSLEIETLQITCDNLRTPKDIIKEYIDLHNQKLNSVNKKRKEIERNIQKISENYKNIDVDKITYNKLLTKEYELLKLESELKQVNNYLSNGVDKVFQILKSYEFVNSDFSLTLKGEIAYQLKEIHSLVFATLINNKNIDTLSAYQIVLLLSCFTNVTVQEEFKSNQPKTNDKLLDNTILHTIELYNKFKDEEINNNVCTGADYSYHFDLLDYIGEWCKAENAVDCKIVLQMLHQNKGIFLGEFVKAILKINNITSEMEKIAEMTSNISLLHKLREVGQMTMKYVVTNQSLYV